MMSRSRTARAFTLIELLIVIAIIGILASVVLVSLTSARERAKVARFKAVVHSLHTKAVEACDSEVIDYTDLTGSFGDIPDDVGTPIVDNGQDCGTLAGQAFSADVPSGLLTTPCTATVTETGITTFTGC